VDKVRLGAEALHVGNHLELGAGRELTEHEGKEGEAEERMRGAHTHTQHKPSGVISHHHIIM
jgi:hypothetical protein